MFAFMPIRLALFGPVGLPFSRHVGSIKGTVVAVHVHQQRDATIQNESYLKIQHFLGCRGMSRQQQAVCYLEKTKL